jgi:PiT family inorganic phosphate transporter
MLVSSGITKIAIFIVISPIVGFVLAIVLENIVLAIAKFVTKRGIATVKGTNKAFRRLQLASAAAFSLGHGANDAQKTMGVIAAIIFIDAHAGHALGESLNIPLWVVLSAHTAIGLGTLFGGWRIVRTLGSKITKLQPVGGFAAETAAAATLFTTATLGIPVSTTHTITGAVVGVGTTNRISAVRWGLTGRVVYAWVLTIPGAALISTVAYYVLQVISAEVVAVAVLTVMLVWVIGYLVRRRQAGLRQAAVFAPPT